VIVYRLATVTALYGVKNSTAKANARLIISVTASLINLVVCIILSKVGHSINPFSRVLRLTYKVLTTTQPSYLHNLITVQPPRSTRSSSLVTFARPSTSSSLRITDRSFQYAAPRLWNQLPASLRQPRTNLSNSAHYSFTPSLKLSFSANLSHHSLPFLLLD